MEFDTEMKFWGGERERGGKERERGRKRERERCSFEKQNNGRLEMSTCIFSLSLSLSFSLSLSLSLSLFSSSFRFGVTQTRLIVREIREFVKRKLFCFLPKFFFTIFFNTVGFIGSWWMVVLGSDSVGSICNWQLVNLIIWFMEPNMVWPKVILLSGCCVTFLLKTIAVEALLCYHR